MVSLSLCFISVFIFLISLFIMHSLIPILLVSYPFLSISPLAFSVYAFPLSLILSNRIPEKRQSSVT
jgi:hypothetical protein